MRTNRHRQFEHVHQTIRRVNEHLSKQDARTVPQLTHTELKGIIQMMNCNMPNVKLDRYTAMVLSIAKGNTENIDVNGMYWNQ